MEKVDQMADWLMSLLDEDEVKLIAYEELLDGSGIAMRLEVLPGGSVSTTLMRLTQVENVDGKTTVVCTTSYGEE